LTPHNTERHNDSSTAEVTEIKDPEGRGCTNIYCNRSESRLFRVTRSDGKTRVLCHEHAVDFISLKEDIDMSSAQGKL